MSSAFSIGGRAVGKEHPPLVVAEIGINHEGSLDKAIRMVDDAAAAGCECAKFQCHVIEDEMIPNAVIPPNAKESIWDIMEELHSLLAAAVGDRDGLREERAEMVRRLCGVVDGNTVERIARAMLGLLAAPARSPVLERGYEVAGSRSAEGG